MYAKHDSVQVTLNPKQLASVYLSWLSQTRSASGALILQKCSMQTVFCKCAYINGPTAK